MKMRRRARSDITIILAAGKSTRMKENKLLLKVNSETLIQHVVKTAKKSSVDELIVVLGYEAREDQRTACEPRLQTRD